MISEFKKIIKQYNLIKENDRVLVGVSGGPDSVCLLSLLVTVRQEYNLKIFVAHLDHMLRKDSLKDAKFVESLARKLEIPLYSQRIDIKKTAKDASLEQEARNARLDFFLKLSKRLKINKIALGHNKDDQAETVLMRIIRGTGLYGLSAILPKRTINGLVIIRPLIKIKKKDILMYLKKRRIPYCSDATNNQGIYLRNRIRNNVLPLLKKNNVNINDSLCNLAENAYWDYKFIQECAQKIFRRVCKKQKNTKIKISLGGFKKQHPALERMVFRLAIKELKGDTRRFNFQHWRELEDLVFNRPMGSIVHLPAKITACKDKKYVILNADKHLITKGS